MSKEASAKKVYSLISLCARAKFLKAGEEKCEKALRNGEAKLIIISRDASKNTVKKFTNKAFYYKVPVLLFGQKYELGKLTGAGASSSLCVTDANFYGLIKNAIELFESPGGI